MTISKMISGPEYILEVRVFDVRIESSISARVSFWLTADYKTGEGTVVLGSSPDEWGGNLVSLLREVEEEEGFDKEEIVSVVNQSIRESVARHVSTDLMSALQKIPTPEETEVFSSLRRISDQLAAGRSPGTISLLLSEKRAREINVYLQLKGWEMAIDQTTCDDHGWYRLKALHSGEV